MKMVAERRAVTVTMKASLRVEAYIRDGRSPDRRIL